MPEGWLIHPSNWLGDVVLDEVCPPGVDVARYLDYHEDPGGLSLALGRGAIADAQHVAVPLPDAWDADWVRDARRGSRECFGRTGPGDREAEPVCAAVVPRAAVGRDLGAAQAARLPINLRGHFASAPAFAEVDDPERWARRASGLQNLIVDPGLVLAALDKAEHRQV